MSKPIIIRNLSLQLSHKTCFEGFSAVVPAGAKIALMGDNGTGKTTLLRALAGQNTLLDGDIDIPPGLSVAYVPQVVSEHNNLSGGERFNKALSLAMASAPGALLLDEPTNHLDIANRAALLGMLQRYPGTLIAASHDPQLLRLVDTIWHISDGKINIFSGNYDDYQREFAQKRASLEARLGSLEREKTNIHRRLMQEQKRAANSRRHGEKARREGKWAPIVAGGKERQAQATAGAKTGAIGARKDEINEQIKSLGLREVITPSFTLSAAAGAGNALFVMDGACGYDGQSVLGEINLSLAAGARAAIIGGNASGKTTLLRAIMDAKERTAGTWDAPKAADIGYLDQHYNNIEAAANAVDVIARLRPDWAHAQIRKHLNDFLLRKNEEVTAKIATLSGGERARLSLAAIACKVPKLLLLDEITNNIDLSTRRHVEQVLKTYPGAVVLVSHDMDFIKTIGVDDVWIAEGGKLSKYAGAGNMV